MGSTVKVFNETHKDSRVNVNEQIRNQNSLQPSHFAIAEMESGSIVSSSDSDAFKSLDWDPDEHWDPDDASPEGDSNEVFGVAFGDSRSLLSDSPSKMDKRNISPYRLDLIEYDDDFVSESVIL